VYDTGFTGIPRIDARLRHQYEVYGEDCIRRAFDHDNGGALYTDVPRSPYCFIHKTKGVCDHASCERGRYRPPDTVRKMRWWIEQTACQAAVHYPSMLDDHEAPEVVAYGGTSFATGGEESKYGTPDFLRRVGLVYERTEDSFHCEAVTALIREYAAPNEAALAEREAWHEQYAVPVVRRFGLQPRLPGNDHAPQNQWKRRQPLLL